jgi:phytoene synthase
VTTALRGDPQSGDTPQDAAATLERSRLYCRDLTRREAKNFYYGLKLLKEPKRSAMYALYAYMRLVDDIADDDANGRTIEQRAADLAQWAVLTRAAIAAGESGEAPRGHIVWPAFAAMVGKYKVPAQLFDDMIAGQRQDLTPVPMATFDDLHQYCYRVASVVGVASLYVWGFDGGEATVDLAIDRGIAFQLTNVLRDLREDAARGRCYLPADELTRFGVSEESIAQGEESPAFLDLMRFQITRAREYYGRSAPLEEKVRPDSRATLGAMTAIYRGILEKIAEDPARVLHQRVGLGKMKKLLIGWRAMRGKAP